jgi:hypothetical protein
MSPVSRDLFGFISACDESRSTAAVACNSIVADPAFSSVSLKPKQMEAAVLWMSIPIFQAS